MKKCSTCHEILHATFFNRNTSRTDGLTNICRPCMVVYQAAHYQRNKKKMNAKAQIRQKATKKYWRDFKDNKPCHDCGMVHRYFALDYDHLDSFIKINDISIMISRGLSKSIIKAEIAKCDLVCATCHRYRTWRRKSGPGEN